MLLLYVPAAYNAVIHSRTPKSPATACRVRWLTSPPGQGGMNKIIFS